MARIKIRDGGDKDTVLDYITPIIGSQAFTVSTCAVALASILAADLVFAQVATSSTVCYIVSCVVSAGVGFVATTSAQTGTGTLNYAVFHVNS